MTFTTALVGFGLIFVSGVVSPPATRAETGFVRPSALRFMTPVAVDHTAEMTVQTSYRSDTATIRIYRSGSHQREDGNSADRSASNYGDGASGRSWTVVRNAAGSLLSLTIEKRSSLFIPTITETEDTDTVLGERCRVWRSKYPESYSELNCITEDGILLWQKTLYTSGDEMQSARIVSLIRRHVKASEVKVPAAALELSSYSQWPQGSNILPNDEVMLRGDASRWSTGGLLILNMRLGALRILDTRTAEGRAVRYLSSDYSLSVEEAKDGTLNRLDLSPRPASMDAASEGQLIDGGATILGEPCQLYDMAVGVADYGEAQCRTSDGLMLQKAMSNRGWHSRATAIKITRGKLHRRDITPPAGIFKSGWKGRGAFISSAPLPPPENPIPRPPLILEWAAYPTVKHMVDYYPKQARVEKLGGVVEMDCLFKPNGRVKACKIESEYPKDYGFGAATYDLFKGHARAQKGTFEPGKATSFTVDWRLPR